MVPVILPVMVVLGYTVQYQYNTTHKKNQNSKQPTRKQWIGIVDTKNENHALKSIRVGIGLKHHRDSVFSFPRGYVRYCSTK